MGIIVYRAEVADENGDICEIRETNTEHSSDAAAWSALSDWFAELDLYEGKSVYVTRTIRQS